MLSAEYALPNRGLRFLPLFVPMAVQLSAAVGQRRTPLAVPHHAMPFFIA